MNVDLDISAVSFSRFGSYIAFTRLEGETYTSQGLPEGIWLRSVHGDSADEVIHLELIKDGRPVPCTTRNTASTLSLCGRTGQVDICLPTPDTVRIRVTNIGLRLTARNFRNHGAIPEPDGNWVLNLARAFRSYRLIPLGGAFSMDAPWTTKHCEHIVADVVAEGETPAELAIEEFSWIQPPQDHSAPFDVLADAVQAGFEQFCKPYLDCRPHLRDTAAKAAYLNWSCVVQPHRLIKRHAIFMSKNGMTNVWAWDHAFNALATCLTDRDLAWDQIMVIFDHQHETGQIPDFVNDVRYLTVFVKPPIHGWILARMIDYSGPLSHERLEQAYEMLSRWTNWWLTYRDPDGDGLPVYWHGNDSGWDNGTVFDLPFPVKSADLAAFLVVQMDTLAGFAVRLGRDVEAERWRQKADATSDALIATLWDGRRFRSVSTVTRAHAAASDSIFGCLPIILGKRLPPAIRKALVTEIHRHMTEWGPATEYPGSPVYDPKGYWRGPIWAPPTMILVDGLLAAGETGLARDIASRFCALCKKSGFAENFNALTGAPLCDRGYTWTSSVFLLLTKAYASDE